MVIKKFKLSLKDQYFVIYVFDSLKNMRKFIQKRDKRWGRWNMDYSNAGALTDPYKKVAVQKDGTETPDPEIGSIYFSKTHFSNTVVCHECIHAALWIYRLQDPNGVANFGKGKVDHEETFARIYHELFRKMVQKMYLHGFWKGKDL